MFIVSIIILTMPLVYNSLSPTHTPNTYPPHSTPAHLSPHPVASIQTSLTHPQTHQHIPPSPAPCPHPHTQNGYLENKHFFLQKLTQSNSLCPCIWIGTNLDWVGFEELTASQGIHFVLPLDFFFLCINCLFKVCNNLELKKIKKLAINNNENKNVIISKWVEVDWVSFGKTLFNSYHMDEVCDPHIVS